MSTPDRLLDLKGLKCPLPVLKTRKALSTLPQGAILETICTDPMAEIDIPDLVREAGSILISQEKTATGTVFRIEKR